MSLIPYREIPERFIKDCRIDYDDPLTYLRVTHMPTGESHYQNNTSNKMRYSQASKMGLRVVYSIWALKHRRI